MVAVERVVPKRGRHSEAHLQFPVAWCAGCNNRKAVLASPVWAEDGRISWTLPDFVVGILKLFLELCEHQNDSGKVHCRLSPPLFGMQLGNGASRMGISLHRHFIKLKSDCNQTVNTNTTMSSQRPSHAPIRGARGRNRAQRRRYLARISRSAPPAPTRPGARRARAPTACATAPAAVRATAEAGCFCGTEGCATAGGVHSRGRLP